MDRLARLKMLCDADPSNPFAWYTLAMEQKKTDPSAALDTFAKLRASHPTYVATYYQQAKTFEQIGDFDRAKDTYREGMKVARAAGDNHAYGELETALDLL
ncbi:tetratricopeptide repeat protein [Myxococcota bacterium]|nr:tetratricopeptide repeat protein [Myxococcota bacterium]